MTDLRELVDMLPGEMRDDALGDYGVTDDDECYYSLGGGFYEPADETKVRREVLGYLVEWLGERGAHIRPCYGGWEFVNDKVQWGTYPTPLEAAVRAVGVIASERTPTSGQP